MEPCCNVNSIDSQRSGIVFSLCRVMFCRVFFSFEKQPFVILYIRNKWFIKILQKWPNTLRLTIDDRLLIVISYESHSDLNRIRTFAEREKKCTSCIWRVRVLCFHGKNNNKNIQLPQYNILKRSHWKNTNFFFYHRWYYIFIYLPTQYAISNRWLKCLKSTDET